MGSWCPSDRGSAGFRAAAGRRGRAGGRGDLLFPEGQVLHRDHLECSQRAASGGRRSDQGIVWAGRDRAVDHSWREEQVPLPDHDRLGRAELHESHEEVCMSEARYHKNHFGLKEGFEHCGRTMVIIGCGDRLETLGCQVCGHTQHSGMNTENWTPTSTDDEDDDPEEESAPRPWLRDSGPSSCEGCTRYGETCSGSTFGESCTDADDGHRSW